MTVYALMGYDSHGEYLLGIYSTPERAGTAKKNWEEDQLDSFDVVKWEVDED